MRAHGRRLALGLLAVLLLAGPCLAEVGVVVEGGEYRGFIMMVRLGDEARAARVGAQLKRLLGQIDPRSRSAQEFLAALHGEVAPPPEAQQ